MPRKKINKKYKPDPKRIERKKNRRKKFPQQNFANPIIGLAAGFLLSALGAMGVEVRYENSDTEPDNKPQIDNTEDAEFEILPPKKSI